MKPYPERTMGAATEKKTSESDLIEQLDQLTNTTHTSIEANGTYIDRGYRK